MNTYYSVPGYLRRAVGAHALGGFFTTVEEIRKALPPGDTLPPEVDRATAALHAMLRALSLADPPGPASTAVLSDVWEQRALVPVADGSRPPFMSPPRRQGLP